MKKSIVLCCALLAAMQTLPAQEKILERSSKKSPAWTGIAQPEQIIVSAQDKTLDAAREQCFTDIRQAIVNAVSVNICSSEQLSDKNEEYNGTSNFFREYESEVKTVAAKLPFITDISLSDAEIYWEHRMNKRSKEMFYVCHVKYPFPTARRNQLIDEFLRQDKEQYDKYLELKANFDRFAYIEEIDRALSDLNPLVNYFFDSRRHDEAVALRRNYLGLYSAIEVVPYENSLGEHLFYFAINGRRVLTSKQPVIQSEFATDIVIKPVAEKMYSVTYNYEQCLDGDENSIRLIYRFGPQAVRHAFSFDVRENKIAVIPFGEIVIRTRMDEDAAAGQAFENEKAAAEKPDTAATHDAVDTVAPEEAEAPAAEKQLKKIGGWIDLRVKYDTPFEVRALSLEAAGIDARIEKGLDASFKGKGTHRLYFTAEGDFTIGKRRSPLMRGLLTVYNPNTQKSEEVRFALPYRILE
ncbi:hypothetical protein [Alistipes sp.]|uniref:hypothetical protein n=1 Tax=Alistipes sp. TaxID=1872444 RepID=UPI0025C6A1D5|nr:hypothetical protein [Alistipes sp.]